jgi:hypothetical protein
MILISILIPLPDIEFFAKACSKNIQETIGLPDNQYELIFLTTSDKSIEGFKTIQCPYEAQKGVHLSLLNHAFYHCDLSDWIYVQHADMFWLEPNWGIELIQTNKQVARTIPHANCTNEFNCVQHKFSLNSNLLMRTHDFAGFYNRQWFVDNQMTFQWGNLKTQLPLSQALESHIRKGNIQWIHRNLPVKINDFVDGSDLIGLEIAAKSEIIDVAPIKAKYIHCWDLFSIVYDFEHVNNEIHVNRLEHQCTRSLHSYSWISSYLLPRTNKLFPWSVLQKINGQIKRHKSPICNVLEKYKENSEVLGDEDMGVKLVKFKDAQYSITT